MIVLALKYDSDAKQLSELNPEIPFSLCEFGLKFGGPECIVDLDRRAIRARAGANSDR